MTWFSSYLSDRKQCVKYGGIFSDWNTINGRIQQGSALGPLLFLNYTNDMPSQVKHGKLLQYADYTALICSGTSTEEVHRCLSADLQSLSSWITQSKIKLNITKSSVMWFTLKNFTTEAIPTVCVGGTALNSVSTQKYLGIVFDKQLSWSSHVSAECKKTSYYLYWIMLIISICLVLY